MALKSLEKPRTNNMQSPDVLIVLGKNIGVGSSPEDMRNDKYHLSRESRLNALAAGNLYKPGMEIIFSGGNTAGEETDSEAEAMYKYFRTRFPDVPEDSIVLEENSITTTSNAQEIKKILAEREDSAKNIGLLSVGYHLHGAVKLFKNNGVKIDQKFAAEKILSERATGYKDYVEAWSKTPRIKKERLKEAARIALLTIDRKSRVSHAVAKRTRK
jgi:uncharacterized SAM-binding protein YcdF (DUF218 family)